MNPSLKMILFGVSAGILSALLWAGFSYVSGRELGWIAWGMGLIIGLGVRWANTDVDGWGPGIMAAAIAVPSLFCGKYLAARLIVAHEFASLSSPKDIDPDYARVEMASEVVAEYESQKRKIIWPEKKRLLTSATKGPQTPDEFPTDVWIETSRRWDKLPTPEKEQRLSVAKKTLSQKMKSLRSDAVEKVFEASFSPFDIFWLLLAIGTAFRVGSRLAAAED